MSFKVQVQTASDCGHWVGNELRFATRKEAEAYASALFARWTAVNEHRVVWCDDPINYPPPEDDSDEGGD